MSEVLPNTGGTTEIKHFVPKDEMLIFLLKFKEVIYMKLREEITIALLMAIGLLLHYIVPPIFMGVKPDLLLSMMFICIILYPTVKYTTMTAFLGAVFSALTTSLPGGQFPNLIEKFFTAFFVFLLLLALSKINVQIKTGIVSIIGTFFSGTVFVLLAVAFGVVNMTAFKGLFITVVTPAAIINLVVTLVLYNIVLVARKATKTSY